MPDDRRYYGLDALRGGMMLLGIVIHGATFYIAAPPPHLPLPADPNRSLLLDPIFDFIHAFRMPCFFVLAGFFAALLVEKRGVAGALRNRGERVLLPLLASMFTILPLTMLLFLDLTLAVDHGTRVLLPTMEQAEQIRRESLAKGVPRGLALLHLWFLLYLCYFCLLIPACRQLIGLSQRFEARLTRALGSPWALPVLALVTAATLWPYPGAMVFGEFIILGFDPVAFAYYGFFFVVGYVYHPYRAATANLTRYIRWCAALAAVLFPLSLYASWLEYSHPAGEVGFHVFAVVAHAFCTWTLIWLFVGIALRFFDKPTPWALYASQSAYWVYLLHMPVVCFVCWLLVPVDVHAVAKFAIVVTVTTLVCFTTYHYWVQDGWIGAFLNGKRFRLDWPWRRLDPGPLPQERRPG
jgi:fucose 4-O-acetylase-like acetyltransferase